MSMETPAVRAEQALLGAILSDEQARASSRSQPSTPRVVDTVKSWILPGNFLRPYHAQVWSAIYRLRNRGKAATPQAVRAELDTDPEIGTDTAGDGVLLHKLMEATPVVARGSMYGGMVVEASLHRQMHSLSASLDQAADTGDRQTIATSESYARSRVKTLRDQWERVPADVRAQIDQPASFTAVQPSRADVAAEARRLAAEVRRIQAQTAERIRETQRTGGPASAADLSLFELLGELIRRLFAMVDYLASLSIDAPRQAAPNGRVALSPGQSLAGRWNAAFVSREADDLTRGPRTAETDEPAAAVPMWRTELEGRLVGSLIRDQRQVDGLALSGEEFSDPTAKALFGALVDIHRRGGVVDELTVAWTAQRAGADVTVASPELRKAITDGWTAGNAVEYATKLAAGAVKDKARRLAERIRRIAVDPRVTPSRLLAESEVDLDVTPTTPAPSATASRVRNSGTSGDHQCRRGLDGRVRRPTRQA